MTPEEFKLRYGYEPSPELQDAWASGTQATKSYENPLREAIGAVVDPFTSRRILGTQDASEDTSALGGVRPWMAAMLDPRLYASGVGDVISKLSSETDDPGLLDWGIAALDAGPLAWTKALKPGFQRS